MSAIAIQVDKYDRYSDAIVRKKFETHREAREYIRKTRKPGEIWRIEEDKKSKGLPKRKSYDFFKELHENGER